MEPSPPRKRRVPSGMEIVTSAFLTDSVFGDDTNVGFS
jgi:hypothetical protein